MANSHQICLQKIKWFYKTSGYCAPLLLSLPGKSNITAFLCYIYWITGQLTCHSAIPELIPGTGSSSTQAHASLTRLHAKAFQRKGYSATWILSLMSCCFLALLGSVVSEVFCSLWFMFMVWPVVITHTSTDLAKYQYLNKKKIPLHREIMTKHSQITV